MDGDQVEAGASLGVEGGVGPVRRSVRAHAAAESPHCADDLLNHGLWAVAGLLASPERRAERPAALRVQLPAGRLGRLKLSPAHAEFLCRGLGHLSVAARI